MGKRKRRPTNPKALRIRTKTKGNMQLLAKELGMVESADGTYVPRTPAVMVETAQGRMNQKHTEYISELFEKVDKLEARVVLMETQLMELGQKPIDPDDLNFRILKFLKEHSPLKFNTGSIAGNLNVPSLRLSDRLRAMAAAGKIQTEKQDGHSAMFWYEQATADTRELPDGD